MQAFSHNPPSFATRRRPARATRIRACRPGRFRSVGGLPDDRIGVADDVACPRAHLRAVDEAAFLGRGDADHGGREAAEA
jgi:hypothetical protein